jgi:hypothetical protein
MRCRAIGYRGMHACAKAIAAATPAAKDSDHSAADPAAAFATGWRSNDVHDADEGFERYMDDPQSGIEP